GPLKNRSRATQLLLQMGALRPVPEPCTGQDRNSGVGSGGSCPLYQQPPGHNPQHRGWGWASRFPELRLIAPTESSDKCFRIWRERGFETPTPWFFRWGFISIPKSLIVNSSWPVKLGPGTVELHV